jgi:hypothetical protein
VVASLAFSPKSKIAWHDSAEAATLSAPLTPQTGGGLEDNTNRPGSDYRSYEIQADPGKCRNDCATDPTCKAFTYVKPGIQGPSARCWLKSAVPNATTDDCCITGVKSGCAAGGGLEVDVDRRGGDYRNYDLPDNNPNHCRDDCQNDPRCKAFTYLWPSFWGPNGHCFLKDSVPNAAPNGCCISGVKGGGNAGGNTTIKWNDAPLMPSRGYD